MPKLEQYFDYVKINLASPERIKNGVNVHYLMERL